MRIIISAAISLDGYLDNSREGERLILSSPEDWRAVHSLRAECDAILVGAETVRQDNPALVIRDPNLRKKRLAEGRTADIMKVVVSGSGKVDPQSKFFTEGEGQKVVFTTGDVSPRLSEVATVISRPELTSVGIMVELRRMGVRTVMIEGGSKTLSMFLREKDWDEMRLAIAPILVADQRAPRLVADGHYPPMSLVKTEKLGQTSVLHFVNRTQHRVDCNYLSRSVHNSRMCEAVPERYSVGAVLVTRDGREFDGYTGETAPENHAEEEAIAKALAAGADLRGASVYSTIEPCTERRSKPETCSDLILRHGIERAVFTVREPTKLAKCNGIDKLADAGVEVVVIPALTNEVLEINAHILGGV